MKKNFIHPSSFPIHLKNFCVFINDVIFWLSNFWLFEFFFSLSLKFLAKKNPIVWKFYIYGWWCSKMDESWWSLKPMVYRKPSICCCFFLWWSATIKTLFLFKKKTTTTNKYRFFRKKTMNRKKSINQNQPIGFGKVNCQNMMWWCENHLERRNFVFM